MNVWSKIVSGFLGICLLFFVGTIWFGMKMDVLLQETIDCETKDFVDNVREHGYLTDDMYSSFLKRLSAIGVLFEVEMDHEKICYEPEYRLRTVDEIIDSQVFTGENTYTYQEVVSNAVEVNEEIDTSSTLNTETNETVMAAAVAKEADADHEHTDACYAGHCHSGGKYFTVNHAHSGCTCYIQSEWVSYTCPYCGESWDEIMVANYWDGTEVVTAFNEGTFDYVCASCGKTMPKNGCNCTSHTSYGYSCGCDIDLDGDGYNDKVTDGSSHEYQISDPISYNQHIVYDNGCYHYHLSYYPTDMSTGKTVLSNIKNNGLSYYCKIPTYYVITYEGTKKTYTVGYQAVVEDDTITFTYADTNVTRGANFPETLTLSQMCSISARTFIKQYSSIEPASGGSSYIEMSDWSWISLCDDTTTGWTLSCGQTEDGTLMCDQIITSIEATNPTQTIYSGNALITTLRVTYLDGSENTIIGSCDFSTSTTCTNKTVTLYYTGYDTATTMKKFTTTIKVTIIATTKLCENGHTYKLNSDGSDPGCPYCAAWLKSLTVYTPSDSTITMTVGTTLEQYGLVLKATYYSGEVEYVTSGYLNNLDTTYVGTQTVTVGYKGKYVYLKVTNTCKKKLCTICGNYYYLFPDGSDPGCPYCQAKIPIFTGNVLNYYTHTYQEDIVATLDSDGIYYMTKDDQFTVTVTNTSPTLGMRFVNMIFHKTVNVLKTYYSGRIRDSVHSNIDG